MMLPPLTSIENLEQALRQFDRENIFLVVDPVAYEYSGAQQRLNNILSRYHVRTFSDFEPNPKLPQALAGAKLLGSDSTDIVLTIGGGTAIDMAKLICCIAAQDIQLNHNKLAEQFTNTSKLSPRRHSLIAVPTTAGTGSEATQFAVVYIDDTKHSVSHPSLLPDSVVLDPTLTHSLPVSTTTAAGLDAVAQAIESMWSVQSTPASIELAEQALRLGLANLEKTVNDPSPASRAAMLQAANLAGQAINISRTTAPHAMSYTMTIRHKIPHGMAVALSMSPFMRFNADISANTLTDSRGIEHIHTIFKRIASAFEICSEQPNTMHQVADRWEQLLLQLNCPTRLSEWRITDKNDHLQIANSVNLQRLGNNPRQVTEQDLLQIVENMA